MIVDDMILEKLIGKDDNSQVYIAIIKNDSNK